MKTTTQFILKTKKDQEVFLKAISEERNPNDKLKETYKKYLELKK